MRLPSRAIVPALGTIVLATTAAMVPSQVVTAQSERMQYSFSCAERREIPITYVQVGDASPREMIRWFDALGGVEPSTRCAWVTDRLNRAYQQGLKYVTHGIINSQPVICATDSDGGSCKSLLFTLDYQGEDPGVILADLLDLAARNFASQPLRQSSCRTYVNLEALANGTQEFASQICSN